MSQEILHYARLPWPADWTAVFDRSAPIVMEIGFGGARFLVDLARKRPSHNVLGLEISLPSLRKAVRKLENAGLSNGRVLQADARSALWLLFTPASVDEVYINFPDPWPKSNHHQRRLISDDFLHLLATRVVPGALLNIATDHADYAAWITTCLERTPYFESRLPSTFVTSDPGRLRTKYEQIAQSEGRTCRYFKWQRSATPAPNPFTISKEQPMPHVVMRSALSLPAIAAQFEPRHIACDGIHIKYLELYQSTHDSKLLIDVYISEEPFHQRLGIAIRPRVEGDFVVSLYGLGFPRPTPGTHVAVHHLVEWLRSLHPDTEIINSTLNVAELA